MSEDPNEYEFPFRTNFELRMMGAWWVAGLVLIISPIFLDVPFHTYRYFGLGFIIFGFIIGRKGIGLYHNRKRLKGYKVEVIDTATNYVLEDLFQVKDKELIHRIIENKKNLVGDNHEK